MYLCNWFSSDLLPPPLGVEKFPETKILRNELIYLYGLLG